MVQLPPMNSLNSSHTLVTSVLSNANSSFSKAQRQPRGAMSLNITETFRAVKLGSSGNVDSPKNLEMELPSRIQSHDKGSLSYGDDRPSDDETTHFLLLCNLSLFVCDFTK